MKKLLMATLAVLVLCVPAYSREHMREVIFIPWSFEIYESPDFRSRVNGRFNAQHVKLREPATLIHDTALEFRVGDWVLVETENCGTHGWINLRYSPALCALDEFFSPLGRNIAVFYKNLDTGFTYTHNPERVFFAASLSKSNHAFYTFQLAERGFLDMYETHTYSSGDEWGGTGILRFTPLGTRFTTRELLGLSMQESDNAAFRMLLRLTENAEFTYHQFVEEIGADTRMMLDVFSQNTHARDAGLFMYRIFRYINGSSRYGHYLKYDMLNTAQTSHPHFTRWEGSNGMGDNGWGTDVNIQMIRSDYPFARKYGWASGAFHDAGIVYAPSPYIIVILSNIERGAHNLFEEIGWFVQGFNHRTFVAPISLDAPKQGPSPYGSSVRVAGQGGFRLSVPVFADAAYMLPDVQTVFRPVAAFDGQTEVIKRDITEIKTLAIARR